MLAKAAAIALLVGAALADSGGAHAAAFYLLLGAVPAAAVAALATLGELVEDGAPPRLSALVQTVLAMLAVALVVVTAAARSNVGSTGHVPQVGVSALVGCFVLYALQGVVGTLAEVRRTRERSRRRVPARADRPLRRAA